MFEHLSQPIIPRTLFARRMVRSIMLGTALIGLGLFIGALGYWYFEGLNFIDALLNASMILTGEGPVQPLQSASGKLFAAAYAVFSGVAFPTTIGIMMAPAVHRFLHKLHLDEHDDETEEETKGAK